MSNDPRVLGFLGERWVVFESSGGRQFKVERHGLSPEEQEEVNRGMKMCGVVKDRDEVVGSRYCSDAEYSVEERLKELREVSDRLRLRISEAGWDLAAKNPDRKDYIKASEKMHKAAEIAAELDFTVLTFVRDCLRPFREENEEQLRRETPTMVWDVGSKEGDGITHRTVEVDGKTLRKPTKDWIIGLNNLATRREQFRIRLQQIVGPNVAGKKDMQEFDDLVKAYENDTIDVLGRELGIDLYGRHVG